MERTEFVNTIKEMATKFGEVTIQTINKPSYSYEGLYVRKVGVPTPVVNLDDLYERYQNGTDIDECLDIARDILGKTADEIPADINKLSEYEYIKNKLYLRLVGTLAENEEDYRKVADMYLVPYADLGQGATFRIPMCLVNSWDMTMDEIYEQARTNQEIIRPVKIKNLAEMMGAPEADAGVYLVSVEDGVCGAGAILYEGIAEKIRDMIGDFYVIPSSIHEVLTIPKSLTDDTKSLGRMVSAINNSSVDEDERLTDSVYTFDFGTGELVKVA